MEQSIKEQVQSLDDDRMAAERNEVLNWLSARSYEQKHHNVRIRVWMVPENGCCMKSDKYAGATSRS
jgi:hypothetical protein